jgi:serine/threonine protein kinase
MALDSDQNGSQNSDRHRDERPNADVIHTVQQWIDHPSWDVANPTDSAAEDLAACYQLFGRIPDSLLNVLQSLESGFPESETDSAANVRSSHSTWIPNPGVEPMFDVFLDEPIPEVPASRFVPQRLLGMGAFGIVLCVQDTKLDLTVALKLLRPSLGQSQSLERRFLREAQAAASLDHCGIVRVFETGRIGRHPYIMTSLVNGPNLADLLKERGGRLTSTQAVPLIARVAEAVQFAHERGVLHRDLKPSNILLEPSTATDSDIAEFRPKLTDFGLAKRVNHQADVKDNLSDGCQILGTLRYMSPEQAAGRMNDVGIGSDIFSLGAILHQTLIGTTPHEGRSTVETLTRILQEPAASLRRIDKSIPQDLDNIVLKCLAREPHDRYASAGDLAADLHRFLRGEPVVARKASWIRRARYWVSQNPAVAGMTTLSAFVIIGSLITVSTLYLRERKAVDLALDAIHESYASVADEEFDDIPGMAEKRYELSLLQIQKFRKLTADLGNDSRGRYALSIAYSRAATAAGRLAMRAKSRQYRDECLALLEALLEEDPDNLDYQYDVFFNRKVIASEFFGPGSTLHERIAMKEAVHRDVLRLLELAPHDRYYRDALASCKYDLAIDYLLTDPGPAETFFRDAWQMSDALWKEHPAELMFVKYSLLARANLATTFRSAERYGEAEQLLREAMSILNAIDHPDRSKPWFEEIERKLLGSLIDNCVARENWAEAAQLAKRCIEIDTRLLALNPNLTVYLLGKTQFQIELLRAERHLGDVPEEAARLAEIESLLAECERHPDCAIDVPMLRAFLNDSSNTPIP